MSKHQFTDSRKAKWLTKTLFQIYLALTPLSPCTLTNSLTVLTQGTVVLLQELLTQDILTSTVDSKLNSAAPINYKMTPGAGMRRKLISLFHCI